MYHIFLLCQESLDNVNIFLLVRYVCEDILHPLFADDSLLQNQLLLGG